MRSSTRIEAQRSFVMIKTFVIAATLVGAGALAAPASAAPLAPATAALGQAADAPLVQTVQWRRYGYGPRYGGYYGRGYYGRGWRGPAVGAGVAAGILGGALAAGALAAPRPVYSYPAPAYGYSPADTDAVAYCASRFRTYNPETGTYIGAGGVVRACP
jgi:hypothetical protein